MTPYFLNNSCLAQQDKFPNLQEHLLQFMYWISLEGLEDSQSWGSSSSPRDKLTASKGRLTEYIMGVSVADSSADFLNTSVSWGCRKKVPKYFTYFILYTFSLMYILYWQYFNMQYFVYKHALSRVHEQAGTDSIELLASLPTCVQTS